MKKLLLFLSYLYAGLAFAASQPQINACLNQIENNPNKLRMFTQALPKGGDLHIHLGGAFFAEDIIAIAQHTPNWHINNKTDYIELNNNDQRLSKFSDIPNNYSQNYSLINTWSDRDYELQPYDVHEHFFSSFQYLPPANLKTDAKLLNAVLEESAASHVSYLEFNINYFYTPSAYAFSTQQPWDNNFTEQEKWRQPFVEKLANKDTQYLNDLTALSNKKLQCNTKQASKLCQINYRYLYQIMRNGPINAVFSKIQEAFMVANQNPMVVGINIVEPEDGYYSLHDYQEHMKIIAYFHKRYPAVNITLHAGELNQGLVPPKDLLFHIKDAIEIGQAQRIGHGADIAFEDNAEKTLQEMAKKHIYVEINLTSNEQLLNMKGDEHPLPLYLEYNVPVGLSTDDPAILRTDLSNEYFLAAKRYHLSYDTLKQMIRNTIAYSFLPGKSLWSDDSYQQINSHCQQDLLGSEKPSNACQAFLAANDKAQQQWQLEQELNDFENGMTMCS